MATKSQTIMDAAKMDQALENIADEIRQRGIEDLSIVGIRTRGVHLARRLSEKICRSEKVQVELGILDINLYRDDLSMVADHPVLRKTEIHFPIGGKRMVLVDDVLFTGRTIRAALDAVIDLGRPRVIELAVLVDRGHRELPIRADFVGLEMETRSDQWVRVLVQEKDGSDAVELGEMDDREP